MAIAAPSDEVIRLIEALGLRTKNTREVTLRMAVNEVVAVNTVEYVNGEQIDALAAELKERQYRLSRWIPVGERLPDASVQHGYCLVSDGTNVGTANYTADKFGGGRFWLIESRDEWHPTHWMPLPEPPEVKS